MVPGARGTKGRRRKEELRRANFLTLWHAYRSLLAFAIITVPKLPRLGEISEFKLQLDGSLYGFFG